MAGRAGEGSAVGEGKGGGWTQGPEPPEEGKQETDEDEELYGGVAIKLASAEAPPAAAGGPVRLRAGVWRLGYAR